MHATHWVSGQGIGGWWVLLGDRWQPVAAWSVANCAPCRQRQSAVRRQTDTARRRLAGSAAGRETRWKAPPPPRLPFVRPADVRADEGRHRDLNCVGPGVRVMELVDAAPDFRDQPTV